ncbi:MAG: CBS domain-containing protein [Anaerolineaceae bacterium]|nr:CBS domain-containing protein [Anaerolineaceae bacterium]
MKIGDCMKRKVFTSRPGITIQKAAEMMVQHHIGTLPIVNDSMHLIGLVTLHDLITPAIPDFYQLVEDLDFVHDFGAAEDEKPACEYLQSPIEKILKEPVYVEETAGLTRAITMLQEHDLNDLPVVDENMRLVGIASRVDIGVALLSNLILPS